MLRGLPRLPRAGWQAPSSPLGVRVRSRRGGHPRRWGLVGRRGQRSKPQTGETAPRGPARLPGRPPPTCRPRGAEGVAPAPAPAPPPAARRPAPIGRPRAAPRPRRPRANELEAVSSSAARARWLGARAVAEQSAARSAHRAAGRGKPRAPLVRTPGPARAAASMGAAAVRWHLCVLLALGARGRLAWGNGLPGKPGPGGRWRRGPGRPPDPAPSGGPQTARSHALSRLFAK